MIYKFQEGGEMAQAQQAPAQNPEAQMQQMAQELAQMMLQQIPDPQACAAVLQMAADMVVSMAQESAPVYQKLGGKLQRVKK